jgi:hypothetical protein
MSDGPDSPDELDSSSMLFDCVVERHPEGRKTDLIPGIFCLPPVAVYEAFLRSSFYHIHLIIPVVDAEAILSSYEDGLIQVNLLLS